MGVLGPLRNREYRKLWFAQLVSVLGDKIHQIAASILVYKITGSLVHVGAMLAVTTLPAVLFGIPAGAAVDRAERKSVMVTADVVRAALVLAIPILAQHGIGFFYAAAFLVATASLFFEPARFSLIPDLVPEEELTAANSLDQASIAVSEIAGLAIGAGLVAGLGTFNAFVVDAASFVVSALVIARMAIPARSEVAGAEEAPSFAAQMAEGVRTIREHSVISALTATYAAAALPMAAANAAMQGLALVRFGRGPIDGRAVGLAAIDAAVTVGLLAGSVTVGQSGNSRSGRKYVIALAAAGVFLVGTASASSIVLALPFVFLVGVANMWFYVPARSILQIHAPSTHLGRIYAVWRTLTHAMLAAGYAVAGFLAQRFGPSTTLVCLGCGMLGISAYGWSRAALREA
ncbi:MAG: MFS transporter [Anaerosomatales bacterium]|nr:MFS transporter [Anaerosomatales bacterium]